MSDPLLFFRYCFSSLICSKQRSRPQCACYVLYLPLQDNRKERRGRKRWGSRPHKRVRRLKEQQTAKNIFENEKTQRRTKRLAIRHLTGSAGHEHTEDAHCSTERRKGTAKETTSTPFLRGEDMVRYTDQRQDQKKTKISLASCRDRVVEALRVLSRLRVIHA